MAEENTQSDLAKEILNRRTVILYNEITSESIDRVTSEMLILQTKSNDPINLIINSGGGSINPATFLCDLISTVLTAPVRGIALGRCGSAATFIMLHCNERIGTPHSRFLIHSGTIGKISLPMNDSSVENLEELLKEVQASEEQIIQMYTKKLTPPEWSEKRPPEETKRKFVQTLIKKGDKDFNNYLSAKEAVEAGLIEKIETGKLGIF